MDGNFLQNAPPPQKFSRIIKFYPNCGAHMYTSLNVKLSSFCVIGTNYQYLCLEMALYYDNKFDNTCSKFISFVKYIYPEVYKATDYIISDREKGFKKYVDQNYLGGEIFMLG